MVHLDIEALRNQLPFEILAPSDVKYPQHLERWAAQRVKLPEAIVFPENAQQVSLAVKQAAKLGAPIAVRSGGMGPYGTSTTEGIIIDLTKMNRIELLDDTALIGGGAIGARVDSVLGEAGRATITANLNLVGFGGLVLGGGFGKLSGEYGLACDNLISAEMVLSDGSIVTASKDEHEDLFWAIRGGGGNFGIVTTFQVKTYEVPKTVYGGALVFPIAQAPKIFDTAAEWEKTADPKDMLGIMLRTMEDELVCLCAIHYTGDEETGKAHFKAFHDLISHIDHHKEPIKSMVGLIPWTLVNKVPIPWNQPGVATFTAHESPSGRQMQLIIDQMKADQQENLNHLVLVQYFSREAICAVPTSATAFAQRQKAGNVTLFINYSADQVDGDQASHSLRRLRNMFDGMSTTRLRYLNAESYPDEDMMQDAFKGNLGRLEAIKAKYDPERIFKQWHGFNPVAEAKAQL